MKPITKQEIERIIRQELKPGTDRGSTQAVIDTKDISKAAQGVMNALEDKGILEFIRSCC